MPRLIAKSQIVTVRPTVEDLLTGAEYAAKTLPWTFNRMMLNTSSQGQQGRAFNIAKGIVGQLTLKRYLQSVGVNATVQTKSYRDDDLFDFKIDSGKETLLCDLKTMHYFTDYDSLDREPLSPELIIREASYFGADWRRFFPMLIPATQLNQAKNAYCFALASSIRPRLNEKERHALTAFPFGTSLPFFSSSKLCKKREEAGRGFYLHAALKNENLLGTKSIELVVVGEWGGEHKTVAVKLKEGEIYEEIGPFSCVSSFQIPPKDRSSFRGIFEIGVSRNTFCDPIMNSLKKNVNEPPEEILEFKLSDFIDLVLPSDYKLLFLGWCRKREFLDSCKKYTGWIWPINKVDKHANAPWSQITDKDRLKIEKCGFRESIQSKPSLVNAGWMKTTGKGGGACSYVYPNIGGIQCGVKETNLYILPQDLRVMSDLGA